MRLLRFKIIDEKFRSLEPGFEVIFRNSTQLDGYDEFSPFCLVGLNGSGKSNLLEALANIFYHLECIYLNDLPEDFKFSPSNPNGFQSEISSPNGFELEYLISSTADSIKDEAKEKKLEEHFWHVYIYKKVNESPEISVKLADDEGDAQKITRTSARLYLPDLIVAYSSGENEILSLPFLKMRFLNYDEYVSKLLKGEEYKQPEGRLIYIDSQMSQALMLSNFLMAVNHDVAEDSILSPFRSESKIEDVYYFRIVLQQDIIRSNFPDLSKEFLGQLSDRIDKLRKCATSNYINEDKTTGNKVEYLDYFVDSEIKMAFNTHFNDSLDLFRTFQILLCLNLYHVEDKIKREIYQSSSLYANETVPIQASDKRVFRFKKFQILKTEFSSPIYYKSLSDGEHQFLHAMGICLLIKNTNALFLLDEPETHFNPEWRAKFISTLKKCFESGVDQNKYLHTRDILITTHSPFIISDCKKENILWFKKEKKDGPEKVNLNTYGASVKKITQEFFGYYRQVADLVWEDMRTALNSEDIVELNDAMSKFGDSTEKNMILEKLNKKILEQRNDE